jgi:hypothetical protein
MAYNSTVLMEEVSWVVHTFNSIKHKKPLLLSAQVMKVNYSIWNGHKNKQKTTQN